MTRQWIKDRLYQLSRQDKVGSQEWNELVVLLDGTKE